jgi:hypothetical protein
MRTPKIAKIRVAAGGLMVAGLAGLFLLRPGIAFAHHIEIEATHTCDTYEITANYIGGSGDRYAEIRVNGVLTQTVQFPGAGPDLVENFFVLTGDLPTNTTVEMRLYVPQPGPDHLESTVSVTVNEDETCTPTATPTSPTNTPVPSATATPEPSDTPNATATPESATQTPPPTSTPVEPTPSATNVPPTSTPRPNTPTSVPATSTPGIGETPTFVSTVESLLPTQPEEPGNSGSPPQETASGLPNAGSGGHAAQIAFALALLVTGAAGLGMTTWGLRERQ